ncbi:hypothetical protein G6F56_009399 [Rhizopus delemar]|nr:hypothetical protein G6F56_009399 [Rhizopus delemar]
MNDQTRHSVLRKLFELCLQLDLESSAPPLDIVQGGFRHSRSALDQALCLQEICRQHKIDHYNESPVLAFLDIKSAYDTVDRAVIWRALETHVSPPMLGILQRLFDNVNVQVLVGGSSSPSFWPRTGVLQGSILSPFLYSIYINGLPALLRSITLPISARSFSTNPQREFAGLWINCLLYADDVVLIAAADVMPRLLRAAEDHSRSLGYRWNPDKCIVLNCPSAYGAPRPKLYGLPIPSSNTFPYLGVPFNDEGKIDTDELIRRNTSSAISSMRRTLMPLGLRSSRFSRLTASRLYATFIRPKFEYGLCLCLFLTRQLDTLDRAQDHCLRMAFGGHSRASTGVFKHLANLPDMRDRAHILVFKFILRAQFLPQDTLLASMVPFLSSAPLYRRFHWPKLCSTNPIWSNPEFTGGYTNSDRLNYLSTSTNVRKSVLAYRSNRLTVKFNRPRPPVLLMCCRVSLGLDPILYLPISRHDRSRLLRWRMGWLPARPVDCRCGPVHASRKHLLSCLQVADRLNVAINTLPNSLDFVINQLPKKIPLSPSTTLYSRWSLWWPVVCQVLFEIETICQPEEEFSTTASNTSGSELLNKLQPRPRPLPALGPSLTPS